MRPLAIAGAAGGGGWLPGVPHEPLRNVEVEELLAPDHAGVGLALYGPSIRAVHAALNDGVELVGLANALRKHRVEVRKGGDRILGEPQSQLDFAVRGHVEHVPQSRLALDSLSVNRLVVGDEPLAK